ncbi:MAG: ATP-binding protein [bacterium]
MSEDEESPDSMLLEIKEGWQYRWGDSPFDNNNVPVWTYTDAVDAEWRPITSSEPAVAKSGSWTIANPPARQGQEILWLRVTLPEKALRDPHLLIRKVRFACEVYIKDKLLYRFKSINVPGQGKFTETPFHLFPLVDNFQGKALFFRIYSEDSSWIGIERVRIGSHADIIKVLIRKESPSLILGILFMATGLIPLILFIGRRDKTYLMFGFLCVCMGFSTLGDTSLEGHFFDARRFGFYVSLPFMFLTPTALCAYFEQILGAGYKSIIRRLWQFNLAYAVAALFLLYTRLIDFITYMMLVSLLLLFFLISIIILFGISTRAALKGNKEARIISAGFAMFCIFYIYNIIIAMERGLTYYWGYWGMFFLIVSLGIVLERRFHNYAVQLQESNEKLREYSQTLEQKVQERTRALEEAHAQLVLKEKMASLGNLVAGVAHEVNTPIGAIHSTADVTRRCIEKIKGVLQSSQTLRELKSSSQLQKSLKILGDNNNVTTTASERIANIVRSLKTFARLDEADYQEADIHEGLDSTLTLIDHEIKDRISVIKDYSEIPEINCYPNQLNQVFMNVLMNAVQAIAKKGQITIKTYLKNGNVAVNISDTGCGIPSESMEKIFDPGFTSRGVAVGTGLGLSISHNIIQKHNGEIKVESEVEKGTSFTILLPIKTVRQ